MTRAHCVILLATATLAAVYAPTLSYRVGALDDPLYLSAHWWQPVIGLWSPLVTLSLRLSQRPLSYALILALPTTMYAATGNAWLTTAFLLCPQRAESFAWLSERKDLLSWNLLCLAIYTAKTHRRPIWTYLSFACSSLSKPCAPLGGAWYGYSAWTTANDEPLKPQWRRTLRSGMNTSFFATATVCLAAICIRPLDQAKYPTHTTTSQKIWLTAMDTPAILARSADPECTTTPISNPATVARYSLAGIVLLALLPKSKRNAFLLTILAANAANSTVNGWWSADRYTAPGQLIILDTLPTYTLPIIAGWGMFTTWYAIKPWQSADDWLIASECSPYSQPSGWRPERTPRAPTTLGTSTPAP